MARKRPPAFQTGRRNCSMSVMHCKTVLGTYKRSYVGAYHGVTRAGRTLEQTVMFEPWTVTVTERRWRIYCAGRQLSLILYASCAVLVR